MKFRVLSVSLLLKKEAAVFCRNIREKWLDEPVELLDEENEFLGIKGHKVPFTSPGSIT